MSVSRAASRPASGATRARIRVFQSGMCLFAGSSCRSRFQLRVTYSRHSVQRRKERAPTPSLRGQHLLSLGGQTVEALAALAALLDPSSLDEAAALEAIERGVERRDVELEGAVGSLVDQLGQFVTMAIALVEQRQDEDFGAAFAKLAVVRHMQAAYVAVKYMSMVMAAQDLFDGTIGRVVSYMKAEEQHTWPPHARDRRTAGARRPA